MAKKTKKKTKKKTITSWNENSNPPLCSPSVWRALLYTKSETNALLMFTLTSQITWLTLYVYSNWSTQRCSEGTEEHAATIRSFIGFFNICQLNWYFRKVVGLVGGEVSMNSVNVFWPFCVQFWIYNNVMFICDSQKRQINASSLPNTNCDTLIQGFIFFTYMKLAMESCSFTWSCR